MILLLVFIPTYLNEISLSTQAHKVETVCAIQSWSGAGKLNFYVSLG